MTLRFLASAVAAAALVWLAFGSVDTEAVEAQLRSARLGWVATGIVFGFLGHALRDLRWFVSIREVAPVPFSEVFRIAQLGFLANVVLPFRLGDGMRAVLMGRLEAVGGPRALGLVAVDRVADLVGLLALLAFAAAAIPSLETVLVPVGAVGNENAFELSPESIRSVGLGLAATVTAAVIALVVLATQPLGFIDRLPALLRTTLRGIAEGLYVLRSTRARANLWMLSVAVWASGVASIACLLTSLDLKLLWYVPVLVQAGIVVFVLAPIAPGLVGQFHLAVILSLLVAIPGLEIERAQAAAILVHAAALVPVGLLAVAALLRPRRTEATDDPHKT